MANTAVRTITEEDEVKYQSLEDLSYIDNGGGMVALYVKRQYEGDIEVWCDAENDERDYICLNYEMVYLDTIREI